MTILFNVNISEEVKLIDNVRSSHSAVVGPLTFYSWRKYAIGSWLHEQAQRAVDFDKPRAVSDYRLTTWTISWQG